jgi:hypothetical protein
VLVVDWLLQMGRKEGRSGRSSSGNGGERRFSMIQSNSDWLLVSVWDYFLCGEENDKAVRALWIKIRRRGRETTSIEV